MLGVVVVVVDDVAVLRPCTTISGRGLVRNSEIKKCTVVNTINVRIPVLRTNLERFVDNFSNCN